MHKIYLMKTDRFIKIGITSNNIQHRLRQVQTGCPLDIYFVRYWVVGTREIATQIEKRIHFELGDRNTHGEWFKNLHEESKTIRKILLDYGVVFESGIDIKTGVKGSFSNEATDIMQSILKATDAKDVERMIKISKRIELMPEKAIYDKVSKFFSEKLLEVDHSRRSTK